MTDFDGCPGPGLPFLRFIRGQAGAWGGLYVSRVYIGWTADVSSMPGWWQWTWGARTLVLRVGRLWLMWS